MDRALLSTPRLALVLAAFVTAAAASAHEGHHHGSPSPSPSASPSASPASAGAPASAVPPAAPSPSPSPAPFHLDVKEALLSHLHNKIVHFPLGLGFAAAIILLVSPRWPQYDPAGRALLVGAALFAVAAYFTGGAQMEPFHGTPLAGIAERHEQLGTTTAIALCLGAALTWVPAARRWLRLYAVLLIVLLSLTGFLGGILAHTEF